MSDWSENLKPGDKVILHNGRRDIVDRVATFARYTKTQIIVDWEHLTGQRFNRKTLQEVGSKGDWFKTSLVEATPERLHEIEVAVLRSRARTELERAAAMTKDMPEPWLRFFVDWKTKMRQMFHGGEDL